MGQTRWDQDQARIRAICARLTGDGVVEPLADRPDDNRAWNGWELASLIEGNFGQQIDVGTLNDEQRAQWESRASWDHRPLRRPHGEYNLSHWLLEDGLRVGTISFATMFKGFSLFSVSSLFVAPAFRGRGIARRALEAAYRAALAFGASGLVLSTAWTWQSSVRFYLHIGMWVRMWKRARAPAYRTLAEAKGRPEAWYDAVGTFALHLALAGWPLIRSDELWREGRYADAGPPEALAHKIEVFEAIARRDGFVVPTLRIPNVAYRDLDDID